MTERSNHIQLIYILALLIFFAAGLQSAHGYTLPENLTYSSGIRVDRCHPVTVKEHSAACCQPQTCHQAAPQTRNLGGPEYHISYDDSHSLLNELRPITPKLKVGKPFLFGHSTKFQLSYPVATNQISRQSLRSLRTTVLLN